MRVAYICHLRTADITERILNAKDSKSTPHRRGIHFSMTFLRQHEIIPRSWVTNLENVAIRSVSSAHTFFDQLFLSLLAQYDNLLTDCDPLLSFSRYKLIRHAVTDSWSLLVLTRLHTLTISVRKSNLGTTRLANLIISREPTLKAKLRDGAQIYITIILRALTAQQYFIVFNALHD